MIDDETPVTAPAAGLDAYEQGISVGILYSALAMLLGALLGMFFGE